MTEITDIEAWLHAKGQPTAVYLADSDCVEYVAEDTTAVYDRVDEFLTLIFDETSIIPIGFKLKGFRNIFERIKPDLGLTDGQFVQLVAVLEGMCTALGDKAFEDVRRKQAYAAASKLAKDVVLYDLPMAA